MADKKKLWKVKNGLFRGYVLDVSYLYGLFFIVTIWFFKLTYGNFIKYLVTNIIGDYIFTFHIVKFFTKVGTFEFKKMRPNHFFIISVFLAVVIYFYQRMIERVIFIEKKENVMK